jgi:hypothetical protein
VGEGGWTGVCNVAICSTMYASTPSTGFFHIGSVRGNLCIIVEACPGVNISPSLYMSDGLARGRAKISCCSTE